MPNFLNEKVSVLFVQKDSIYKSLVADCYDEERNALTFSASNPVIAHPPCRLFSKLRAFSTAPQSEKELAYFAVKTVQKNGGVLEHPKSSTLWKECNLPLPGSYDKFGGFTICINQSWFGARMQKATLLYIVGISHFMLPRYPISFDLPTHTQSSSKKKSKKKEVTKRERSATPLAFAEWLIKTASLCKSPTTI
jgi:hypothetical protein